MSEVTTMSSRVCASLALKGLRMQLGLLKVRHEIGKSHKAKYNGECAEEVYTFFSFLPGEIEERNQSECKQKIADDEINNMMDYSIFVYICVSNKKWREKR